MFDYALRESRLSGGYDHVWLAYDRDDFDLREFDSVVGKCAQSSDETTAFHALWSNPCFEVWMLLHFGYTTAEMTSAEAIAKTDDAFRKYLKRPYKKSDTKLFENLSGQLIDAIPNAERLNGWHEERCMTNPSVMNPGTHLYEIVNTLQDYLR